MQSANWVEAETGRKKSSYLLPHSEAICQGDVMQIFYEQCRADKKSRAHRNAHSPAGQSDSPAAMLFSMYPALRKYSRSIFRAGEYVLFASAMKFFRQCRRWGLDALGGECCIIPHSVDLSTVICKSLEKTAHGSSEKDAGSAPFPFRRPLYTSCICIHISAGGTRKC